jgi:uncharacterized damage-inducible protein DinB
MSQNRALIAELQMEAANTRKTLEKVPVEKNDWKPHPKSMTLGRLASHVAEIPGWITMTLNTDELDFAKWDYKPHVAQTTEELVGILDKHVGEALAALENAKDEDFDKMWTMRNGEHVYYTLPKKVIIRSFGLSHNYHHRAQLGVYLRLLDVPVPGVYGPTADEMPSRPVEEQVIL